MTGLSSFSGGLSSSLRRYNNAAVVEHADLSVIFLTARAKVTGLSLQLLASAVRSDATMTSHGLPAEGQRKSAAIVSTGISNYPSLKYYIIFAHADPSYVST